MIELAEFVEGLRRQRDNYRAMVGVGEEQMRLLAAADVDALLALVERKRALLGEIEALERDLLPAKERWARVRPTLDAQAVGQVEALLAGTSEVLRTLLRLEDEARALMAPPPAAARARAARAYGA